LSGGVVSPICASTSDPLVENATSSDGTCRRHSTLETGAQLKRMIDGSTLMNTTTSTGKELELMAVVSDELEASRSIFNILNGSTVSRNVEKHYNSIKSKFLYFSVKK
jgi:hypothetical protein